MLTKEAAQQQVAQMTNAELDRLSYQVTGRHDDADTLATQAALELSRRNEQAAATARQAEPIEAARRHARIVWEQAGSPGDFDSFFAQHQRQEAHEQLDRQRNHAAFIYGRKF